MNELYLEDGDPKFLFSYLITEGGRKIAGIYASKEPIDGHWLVKAHKLYANGSMLSEFDVIGVTSHEENIPNKTYEKALQYGQQIAKGEGLNLSDKTKMAKSRLEQLARSEQLNKSFAGIVDAVMNDSPQKPLLSS